jgi:CubicO group peptidase (beta-lactamase class C family)
MDQIARTAALATALLVMTPAVAGPLAHIEVIPAFATLGPGETQAYSAVGYDAAGDEVDLIPVWIASGGTIDADGLYTAPTGAGRHRIEVSAANVLGVALVNATGEPTIWPGAAWLTATPIEAGLDEAALARARDYALRGAGSGFIARAGRRVYSWGDLATRYDVKSATKSIGGTLLGLAIADGLVRGEDRAQTHLAVLGLPPDSNAATGWLEAITLLHLATHTAGFEKAGGYTPLDFPPGTRWSYSDGGANWLADVLTELYGQDLHTVLFTRAFSRMGITTSALTWRSNIFREDTLHGVKRRELAAGISANVDAMARLGQLYLRRGVWQGQRVLPESFIRQVERPARWAVGLPIDDGANFASASDRYGVLWWTNADGALADVPREAFWAWGLGDSLIVVIPQLDMVVVRAGEGWREGWSPDYDVLEPFLTPIVAAVQDNAAPLVSAGADLSLTLPERETTLTGAASDDGKPSTGGLAATWTVVHGEDVAIATPAALTTAVSFPGAGAYTLRLTVSDGAASASDEVTVTVLMPPPALGISASASRVNAGSSATLNWTSSHADSCIASNGWTGAKAPSGTESVTVSQTSTYTLECSGPSGTVQSSVTIEAAPAPPPGGGEGGGGGTFPWWSHAALTLLLLRRLRRLQSQG